VTSRSSVASPRFHPSKGAQALVRPTPDQGLQTQSNSLGISLGGARGPGIAQQTVVDVKGLLHTDNYAI
jgi:hypothetical protein